MKHSAINLDLYINPDDLKLLRNKKSRKDKDCKDTIITRSLDLVKEAKEGNIESRNYLFTIHTPLMRSCLNRWFSIPPTEFDDYLSWCFDSFLESVKSFDPEKSNNFIYLLKRKLYNFFINKYKSKEFKKITVTSSLDYYIETDELNAEKYLKYEDKNFDKL